MMNGRAKSCKIREKQDRTGKGPDEGITQLIMNYEFLIMNFMKGLDI